MIEMTNDRIWMMISVDENLIWHYSNKTEHEFVIRKRFSSRIERKMKWKKNLIKQMLFMSTKQSPWLTMKYLLLFHFILFHAYIEIICAVFIFFVLLEFGYYKHSHYMTFIQYLNQIDQLKNNNNKNERKIWMKNSIRFSCSFFFFF